MAHSTGQQALCRTYRTARANQTIAFVWFGGPYVEVFVNQRKTQAALNVWDYSTGAARVPYTYQGLKQAAQEWLSNTDLGTI
jgi:hypothetical protein